MGKIQLSLIVVVFLCGCAASPPNSVSSETVVVSPPWGYVDYCNRHPDRLECGKK